MDDNKFSGYYCKKCNSIPLIQIIPKINNIKILTSCKCNKQYQNIDSFIKNYYFQDIDALNITSKDKNKKEFCQNNQKEKDFDIKLIIDKFNKAKEKLYKEGLELKNKIIDFYQRKIDKINEVYNSYIINNNKIILLIEQIIKSYQLITDNQTSIKNINNNCLFNENNKARKLMNDNFNLEKTFEMIVEYFKEEYIFSDTCIKEGFEIKSFFYNKNSVKCLIEMGNNICAASLNNDPNIILFDLNNLNEAKIAFKAHQRKISWIDNNLITCGDNGEIKIWPVINQNFISERLKSNENEEGTFYKANKLIYFDIKAILIYKSEDKEMEKIEKMIEIKDNEFLAFSPKRIFLYKYIINN